jgi:hypothetical protein
MSSAKTKITLKKNKEINKIWHQESTLVFKSAEEKVVIGRYTDDELIPIDSEALSLCEEWGFKYDKSLVEEEQDEEEQEQDEEDQEQEEEQEQVQETPTKEVKQEVVKPEVVKPEVVKPEVVKPEVVKQTESNSDFKDLTDKYNKSLNQLFNGLTERIKILESELRESRTSEESLRTKLNKLKSMFE